MSLLKQLWLAIFFLMFAAFTGSFIVSSYSARQYLSEQLLRKNFDNASSLAISLSSVGEDSVSIELYISAQFDTGHYDWIRLIDNNGNLIFERKAEATVAEAPKWLRASFPIKALPGVAHVSNGWQQIGTLSLSSNTGYAYEQLWVSIKRLFVYFLVMAISAGVIGSRLLRYITRPLDKAVEQAEAIGERRFITSTEPSTLEFKAVIRSLNKLSAHVKSMLTGEAAKLDQLRKQMNTDATTGILNREPALNHFHSFLHSNDVNAHGLVILFRIQDLFQLNKAEGRLTIDNLLQRLGKTLLESAAKANGVAGKLNGSDFFLVLPRLEDNADIGRALHESLMLDCQACHLDSVNIIGASSAYVAGETTGTVLRRMDVCLTEENVKTHQAFIHIPSSEADNSVKVQDWENILNTAIATKAVELEHFPVVTTKGEVLHYEAPACLKMEDGTFLQAGVFLPHASRLKLSGKLDMIVLQRALDTLEQSSDSLSVNLSASLLKDTQLIVALADTIKARSQFAQKLWLEIPEYAVFQQLVNFRTLAQLLKPLRCKLGIEHASQEFLRLGELHDLGLDFIKVDRCIVHGIDNSVAYQVFVRGLCTIVHSIGLQVIAEGVERFDEWDKLVELGVDAGAGEYFTSEAYKKP